MVFWLSVEQLTNNLQVYQNSWLIKFDKVKNYFIEMCLNMMNYKLLGEWTMSNIN